MREKWIALAVVGVCVVLGAVAYIAKPMMGRGDGSATQDGNAAGATQSVKTANAAYTACVGSANPQVSRASLDDKYHWARTLLDQKLPTAALPNLSYVAAADPGYPGINLDISDASLQLRYATEARDAVQSQMSISECLARLPPEALDAYCKAELPKATSEGCRAQLTYIGRAAELQSTLVHVELDRPASAAPVPTTTARAEPTVARPAASVKRTEEPSTRKTASEPRAEGRPAPRKTPGDKGLQDGEGTDSALGAYSKPQ